MRLSKWFGASVMAALFLSAAIYAPAALAREGLEIRPAPTEGPTAFTGTIGSTEIIPANRGNGSQAIICSQGYVLGEFFTARRGSEHMTLRECYLEGLTTYPVRTKGAASGEIVAPTTPVFLARDGVKSGLMINPNYEEGPPPTTIIPQVVLGTAVAGPLSGSRLISLSPLNTMTTTLSFEFSIGGVYENEKGKNIWVSALSWTSFGNVSETATIRGKGTLTLQRRSELVTF